MNATMPRRAPLLLGILAATLGAAGCASMRGGGGMTRLAGDWNLVALSGTPIEGQLAPNAPTPTLRVEESGKISGFAGVNRFSSALDLDAAKRRKLAVEPIALTRMAGPPEAMRLERQYMDALARADAFGFERGGTLTLRTGEAEVARLARTR